MTSTSVGRLRRFASRATDRSTCDLCRSNLQDRHRHLLESGSKRMLCACDACALLFSETAGSRFRPIPESVRRIELKLTDAEWAGLGIPIGLAFFTLREPAMLRDSSSADREWSTVGKESGCGVAAEITQLAQQDSTTASVMVGYPSPAGPVMSSVEPEDWQALLRANPDVSRLQPDVESLLINRTGGLRQAFVVPLDVCFELIGIVRRHWQGWSGGPDVQSEIDRYFDQLERSAEKGART